MIISTGLGSIDDYIPFVDAGSTEFYCGYIPEYWATQIGHGIPLNRREVLFYNVQIGSRSELQILGDMVQAYHIPVNITLNSPSYPKYTFPILREILCDAMDLGFTSFIIADPALLHYLHETHITKTADLILSGEIGEQNHSLLSFFRTYDIKRIIFHRRIRLDDMAFIIQQDKAQYPNQSISYEAFILNELCHYHGGYCNSLHCDELSHICKLPYRFASRTSSGLPLPTDSTRNECPSTDARIGESGCGLCALWELRSAGITHLKIVSRGNYEASTIRDIQAVCTALSLLDNADCAETYRSLLRTTLFRNGCSKNCYYPENSR